MNYNHKQSLYQKFRNWNRRHEVHIPIVQTVLIIVACIVACLISYINYGDEVNTYDVSNYEYLSSVVDNIWDEDTKNLNIANIPDNVSITDAKISASGTSFKCSLNTDNFVVGNPFINVQISNDFDVKMAYYSEKEYVGSAKSAFLVHYIICFFLSLFAVILGWELIKILIYLFCIVCLLVTAVLTKFTHRKHGKLNGKKENYRCSYDASKDV